MVDPLDPLDEEENGGLGPLPPLPPGIVLPPPPPTLPDLSIPPPSSSDSNFGFAPSPGPDSDLLDAASSLSTTAHQNNDEGPTDFKSVWERRKASHPSANLTDRDSIYNRINRISSKKGGSLMERYSDRFGTDLDKEIIVMRKKDQADLASVKPTVELLSAPTKPSEMSFEELIEAMDDDGFLDMVSEKTGVSGNTLREIDIDSLKAFFIRADSDNSGSLNFDEFVNGIIDSYRSHDEDFSHFFSVINNLLGELPEDKSAAFISSDGFDLFKQIGESPDAVESSTRGEFFKMVNELLVDLPEQVMQSFVNSPDFELYKQIAERYGDT